MPTNMTREEWLADPPYDVCGHAPTGTIRCGQEAGHRWSRYGHASEDPQKVPTATTWPHGDSLAPWRRGPGSEAEL